MFVTSEKYPGRAQKPSGDLESVLAALVVVADGDQSPCPLWGVMCVGKSCVQPDVGTFQLQSKQCLLVLPSRLKHCFGGCVMVLECDAV